MTHFQPFKHLTVTSDINCARAHATLGSDSYAWQCLVTNILSEALEYMIFYLHYLWSTTMADRVFVLHSIVTAMATVVSKTVSFVLFASHAHKTGVTAFSSSLTFQV